MGNTLDKKGAIDPKYLLPQAPYSKTAWDSKLLKKSVMEKRLAPFFPGAEEKASVEMEECPICFLYYPGGLNRAKCCKKGVCSECYIQIKKGQNSVTSCPFFNNRRYMTVYTGPLSKDERDTEEREEKKVQDLRAKIQLEESQRKDSAPASPSPQLSSSSSSVASSPASPLSASSPYSSERKDSASVPLPVVQAAAPAAPVYEIFVPPLGANAEEAMIAEAIRRSLLDSSGAPEASSTSEPPQSVASEHDSVDNRAHAPEAPLAAPAIAAPAVVAPSSRRIALEDPSEESDSSSSSSSSSSSEKKELRRHVPRREKRRSDDAALREAIRLSLMEEPGADRTPAASRP